MTSPQTTAAVADINHLRAERARINDAVQALAHIEAEGGALTENQAQEFDTLQAKFNALTERICRLESAEQMAAAAAQPVDTAPDFSPNSAKIAAWPAQGNPQVWRT